MKFENLPIILEACCCGNIRNKYGKNTIYSGKIFNISGKYVEISLPFNRF